MQLPNAHRAYVSRKKLTEYLLSLSHPSGASKALFFRAIGYSQDNADELAHAGRFASHHGSARYEFDEQRRRMDLDAWRKRDNAQFQERHDHILLCIEREH